MKKILIVSFYELKEHLLYISETLKNYMYDIDYYPLFCYAYDKTSKISNYIDHFDKYIKNSKPDIILWWFLDIPEDDIKLIVSNNENIYYIMFNNDIKNINLFIKKSLYFNLVIATNDEDKKIYIEYNKKNKILDVDFNCITYKSILNDNYFYKIEMEYIYDIFIITCCENKKNENHIDKLIQYLDSNNKKYKMLNLCDKKEINIEKNNNEMNKIINSSKIILCDIFNCKCGNTCEKINIGDVSQNIDIQYKNHDDQINNIDIIDYEIYCKKLIYNILLSGNLLMTSEIKNANISINSLCEHKIINSDDIEKYNIIKNTDYIYVDNNDIIKKIEDVLINYNKMTNIVTNSQLKMQKLLWNNFGILLHENISKFFFDAESYALLYELNSDMDLWDHWLRNKKNICYEFEVDPNFDYKKFAHDNFYIQKKDIKVDNIKKLYLEWIQKGKSSLYIKKTIKDIMFEIENINLTMEQWFELNAIFNEIRNNNTMSLGLQKLHKFQKNNELVDVNKMLDMYIKLCDL